VCVRVAQAAQAVGARVVYASTSEVYGDRGTMECWENMPGVGEAEHMPHNLYGLTKLWGEQAFRMYAPDGLQIVRLSMPYGPGVPPGRGRAAINNVLWQAATGQPIPIHEGAERSWCWIGDTVAAIRMVLEHGAWNVWSGSNEGVFNVGRDDDARPMLEVAHMACDMVGASRDLVEVVAAPNMQTVVKRLSTSKLAALGWRPSTDLETGMARVLEWVRQYDRDGNKLVPNGAD